MISATNIIYGFQPLLWEQLFYKKGLSEYCCMLSCKIAIPTSLKNEFLHKFFFSNMFNKDSDAKYRKQLFLRTAFFRTPFISEHFLKAGAFIVEVNCRAFCLLSYPLGVQSLRPPLA